jgi:methionyl-tRNA formyltransferase
MRYDPIEKVILFGGSLTIVGLAKWLKSESKDVKIYTSTRHAKEPLTKDKNLEELIQDIGVPYVITEDINTEDTIRCEITDNTIGIGIGEAWSFDSDMIDSFKGKLLDFMGIPLPRYRGGAHYTWMILGDEKNNGMRLQVINEEMIQGVFDSGEIVDSIDYEMDKQEVKPSDFFAREVTESINFIKLFLTKAISGENFELKEIDESKSLYLPRLYTDVHAWIDWRRWNGLYIERFINAFDEPYVGARTTLNNRNIRIKDVKFSDTKNDFHPFQSGLVVRKDSSETTIAVTGGLISVGTITDDDGTCIVDEIRIGQRFYTPEDNLEKALTFEAVYDASGLKS